MQGGSRPRSLLYFKVLPRHVYVHVPFCARRCTYCDFSIAVRRVVPSSEYVDALAREIDLRFPNRDGWTADTLYFGGGTPSRLGGEGVARMLTAIRERITLADGAEVTLEANPDDVNAESVAAWRDAGVNRLSIGAQSFDDRVLEWMHRTHDAGMTARAVDTARRGGIDNFSLDLIFSLPEKLERSWTTDVARALELGPSHLSLYGLTIEPHTPLGRSEARGDVIESPDERYETEFLHAHDALTSAGFDHYEVSNFGLPGLHARHNSSYWSGAPYAGLGPSAHEFDGAARRWNRSAYVDWMRHADAAQDPIEQREELTPENKAAEEVYLGLRTTGGLVLRGAEIARVQPWVNAGWATLTDGNRLVLTPLGWLRLDAIAADLTLVRSHY
ncbi:MAG: oxygen-independent coproporphyrinogen oxidase [Gemmatimonadetes bacterium]|nr:oxygen-independent coproporphyrinogen oxidase [Gemmatimonadota bacterium]